LEVELKSNFDHVNIELISSGGGVFEVTLNNDLIFSKKILDRFPEEGEIEKLIRENLN
jgi:selenoprotein W-related protein